MSEIKKLTEYSHTRKRSEMYLGSRSPHTQEILLFDDELKPVIKEITWVPALFTAFREILDNALDEVIGHQQGDRIDIEYDQETVRLKIQDNGRGIPIDWDEAHQMHKVTLALTNARAGRNFEERGNVVGTNGIGAAATAFCSKWFNVTVYRDQTKFEQKFQEGNRAHDQLIVHEPKITSIKSNQSGTIIECELSRQVFETIPKIKDNMILPEQFVKSRIIEIAAINPKTKFYFNGQKIKLDSKFEKNFFPNAIVIDVDIDDIKSTFYLVPEWECENEFIHSIVNNIPAFNGGVHIDGFRRGFYKNLISELKTESKRRKLTPNNSDVQSGLMIFNVTQMTAPDFDSQSKTRLINENVNKAFQKFFDDPEIYKKIIKKNPDWIDSIYERCSQRTKKKDQDEIRRLNRKNLRSKIPKLRDANGKDRSKCILIISEGDSAIAGAFNVRDPQIHAGLPIRGKVMNVHTLDPKKILANEELSNLMSAIGLSIGQKAKFEELNYGQVYIAADMDHDGANITALLVNFFYKFWPELFLEEQPLFQIFQTPFIIAQKGKQRKYWYSKNYHEFNSVDYKGWEITRAKGLGTLTSEDWKHSLYNPELVPVIDDGNLKETLDLIFNPKRSDDRKEWMK